MLYQCMSLGETHTYVWAYMPLGTTTTSGSPTKYSMDTYFTFAAGKFYMAFFETKPRTGTKMVQKHFGNVLFMTVYSSWNVIE